VSPTPTPTSSVSPTPTPTISQSIAPTPTTTQTQNLFNKSSFIGLIPQPYLGYLNDAADNGLLMLNLILMFMIKLEF